MHLLFPPVNPLAIISAGSNPGFLHNIFHAPLRSPAPIQNRAGAEQITAAGVPLPGYLGENEDKG